MVNQFRKQMVKPTFYFNHRFSSAFYGSSRSQRQGVAMSSFTHILFTRQPLLFLSLLCHKKDWQPLALTAKDLVLPRISLHDF